MNPIDYILCEPNRLYSSTMWHSDKHLLDSLFSLYRIDKCKAVGGVPPRVLSERRRGRPPSCPRLRRTISCRAPMLPSMASSSLAFMSLDFLKVRLFIRSNAFFPCIVNTTWALFPWRGRACRRADREHKREKLFAAQQSTGKSRLVVQKWGFYKPRMKKVDEKV